MGLPISIDENGLRLAARSSAGIFYSAQTIRQLPVDCAGTAQLPCAQIEDARALPGAACIWMCAATFFRRLWRALPRLDGPTQSNVFHWHLTEDQGWRLAVDKYPAQEVSAWRTGEDGSQ